MSTCDNAANAINFIIAENEDGSPFKPFPVRRGKRADGDACTETGRQPNWA